MNEEQIKKELERKALIRKYAEEHMKGELNCNDGNIEQKIVDAADSATLPLVRETEMGGGKFRIWKKVQKKYLSIIWAWYLNALLLRQTRYNKELIDIVQLLNQKIDEQKRTIDLLERRCNSSNHNF